MLYKSPFDRNNVRIKTRRGDWKDEIDLKAHMGSPILYTSVPRPAMINVSGETDMYESPYMRVKLSADAADATIGGIERILTDIVKQSGLPTIDLQDIVSEIVNFIKSAGSTVTAVLNELEKTTTTTINTAADGVTGTIDALKTTGIKMITDTFNEILEAARLLGEETLNALKKASELALKEADNLSNTVLKTGEKAFDTMNNMAQSTVSMLQNTGQQLINDTKKTLITELTSYKQTLESRLKDVMEGVGKLTQDISGDTNAGFFQKNKKQITIAIIVFIVICIIVLLMLTYRKRKLLSAVGV